MILNIFEQWVEPWECHLGSAKKALTGFFGGRSLVVGEHSIADQSMGEMREKLPPQAQNAAPKGKKIK